MNENDRKWKKMKEHERKCQKMNEHERTGTGAGSAAHRGAVWRRRSWVACSRCSCAADGGSAGGRLQALRHLGAQPGDRSAQDLESSPTFSRCSCRHADGGTDGGSAGPLPSCLRHHGDAAGGGAGTEVGLHWPRMVAVCGPQGRTGGCWAHGTSSRPHQGESPASYKHWAGLRRCAWTPVVDVPVNISSSSSSPSSRAWRCLRLSSSTDCFYFQLCTETGTHSANCAKAGDSTGQFLDGCCTWRTGAMEGPDSAECGGPTDAVPGRGRPARCALTGVLVQTGAKTVWCVFLTCTFFGSPRRLRVLSCRGLGGDGVAGSQTLRCSVTCINWSQWLVVATPRSCGHTHCRTSCLRQQQQQTYTPKKLFLFVLNLLWCECYSSSSLVCVCARCCCSSSCLVCCCCCCFFFLLGVCVLLFFFFGVLLLLLLLFFLFFGRCALLLFSGVLVCVVVLPLWRCVTPKKMNNNNTHHKEQEEKQHTPKNNNKNNDTHTPKYEQQQQSNLERVRFNRRGGSTPLWRVESWSLPSRWPNPIPAIPPYVVRTPHLHGAPTTEETSRRRRTTTTTTHTPK